MDRAFYCAACSDDDRYPHATGCPSDDRRMTASEVTQHRAEFLGRNTLGIGVEPSGIDGAFDKKPAGQPPADAVKAPSHYMLFDGIESIEVIARSMTVSEFRGFCFGNVLKYHLRAGKKSELATMEQDLKKAAFYQELFDKHKGLCYESK